jgi:hypothetical protein
MARTQTIYVRDQEEVKMNTVFQLFEGECPTCGNDTSPTKFAGTEEYFRDHPAPKGYPVKVWDQGVTERGQITFQCDEGHVHHAWNTSVGDDWVA